MAKFIKENLLSIIRPDLEEIWDFKRNEDLGLDFYKMTKGSDKKAWWYCSKCDDSYDMVIKCKAIHSQRCPYCAGKRIHHTNSLATLKPQIASEWHPTKNGELTPYDVTCGKQIKVWWLGECGHEWDMNIDNRTTNLQGCPYCARYNSKILIGFNDIWTTNLELAKLLLNPEDGYKYTQNSGRRVDWKCLSCNEVIRNKRVADIGRYGLSCPKCNDGVSFNEKFFYCILNQLNVYFERQSSFSWSEDKRYDFYLPEYSLIIETHGIQHFEESGFSEMSGITLEEQQENDKHKYEVAIENGIENYIVIDCRYSELEWIKSNTLNSEIASLFDLSEVDWLECSRYATKSLVVEVCDYWKNNDKPSTDIIAKIFKTSRGTIINYLKQGKKNGWCDYTTPKENKENREKLYGKPKKRIIKKIVQLDLCGTFIKEWGSASEAFQELKVDGSSIRRACMGKAKTAGGFRWMYKEEYEDFSNSPYTEDVFKENLLTKVIMQLSKDGELIKEWQSVSKICKELNFKSKATIYKTLKDIDRTSHGFKWMYKEDYEKLLKVNNI